MKQLFLGTRQAGRGDLVLVNAACGLSSSYGLPKVIPQAAGAEFGPAATRTTLLTAVDGDALTPALPGQPAVLLQAHAAAALQRLVCDALQAAGEQGAKGPLGDDCPIVAVSGWRPRSEQQTIWDETLATEGEAFTRQYVALPGHSEHETGLAIDLGRRQAEIDFIRPAFPTDGVFGCFRALAPRYGFVQRYCAGKEAVTGIAAEPWHFRYVGGPHALAMQTLGLALEEYLAFLAASSAPGRPWRFCQGDVDAEITCCPVTQEGCTLPLPLGRRWQLSGTGTGQVVLTVWRTGHGC